MKQYFEHDAWRVIQKGFDPKHNKIGESICSLGNGCIGHRANFEEQYSGETLQGNYIAGVYYPDKTRVGWWKNGYPEYFAKVLNSPNWLGINVNVDGEELDLAHCHVSDFLRVLNMQHGYLERSCVATLQSGKQIKIHAQRFVSIVEREIGALTYTITPLNFSGAITVTPYLDADVKNQDANYDEKFWDAVKQSRDDKTNEAFITVKTKKTEFYVCVGTKFSVQQNGKAVSVPATGNERTNYIAQSMTLNVKPNDEITIHKFAAILSSQNHQKNELLEDCRKTLLTAFNTGFATMLKHHSAAWEKKWLESDVIVEGDVAAQQGIRFNIFQLNQTYTGEDERLNIGPKGMTGEKYGGSTYWDTEAYCLAFYLSTAEPRVAKNLLLYRYKHLTKAIENAAKLGFKNGAALYPMVTMNGEECHNEWEITFEEIHRNGAIARAIYDYIRYTGDQEYLLDYGTESLIAIARFWAQRVNWSEEKQKYVILGVTGPNEYENNVNNNWYTNTLACWCMDYAIEAINYLKKTDAEKYSVLVKKINFAEQSEVALWQKIVANMHFPVNEKLNIFLQQDGYMDKEQILVKDLDRVEQPINQKWSWDRILRSCFIKQADTLQGIYLFEDRYDLATIKRNFDFYEPRTVHESSLSPCVHSILAAKIGYDQKAYELYLRTARLDLDNYNNDTDDGCHITSMAGSWMSIVQGFGGMRVRDGQLYFHPFLPKQWQSYSFKILFRGNLLRIKVTHQDVQIINETAQAFEINVAGKKYHIGDEAIIVSR